MLDFFKKTPEDPHDSNNLRNCFKLICEYYDVKLHDSLIPPRSETPAFIVRLATKLGFNSSISRRELSQISDISLPLILITKNNGSLVLKAILTDGFEIAGYQGPKTIKRVSKEYLENIYTGFCIDFTKKFGFDKRALELTITTKPSWIKQTISQYKKIYYQMGVATVMINIFAMAYPLFVMNVYDRVIPNNSIYTLWALVIGILLIYLFDFIIKVLRTLFVDIISKSNNAAIEAELFEKVIGMHLNNMPKSAGGFANGIKDVSHVREFFTSGMLNSIIDLPFVIVFLIIIGLLAGPAVTVVSLCALFLTIAVSLYYQAKMQHSVDLNMQALTQKQAILVETLNNLENVKGIGSEDRMQMLWKNYLEIENEHGHNVKFYSGMASNISQLIQQAAQVATILWGSYKVLELHLTVGTLIACSILVGRVLAPISNLSAMLIKFRQVKQALFGIDKILNTPQEFSIEKQYIYKSEFSGNIIFEHVSFAYPNAKILTLNDINLTIKKGEKIGIVGYMGSGKTTILRLIMKLYDTTKGMIKLDNIDISQIDPFNLRMFVGYVSQEPSLFFGTIRDNLLVGNTAISDEKLAWAAEKSGLLDFIGKYPQGISFPVGEGGAGLSFGQRQTINIARCLLREPKILLMDEPTSGMDNTSELYFIKRFQTVLTPEHTFILVTHRKSLLALVDRVIIMHNGKIVKDTDKNSVLDIIDSHNK